LEKTEGKQSLEKQGVKVGNIKIDLKQIRRILTGIMWGRKTANGELM
jgi:hypothetical protein